jgi:hypothetical protein
MLYFCTEYKIKNNEKINIIARCPLATTAMSAQTETEKTMGTNTSTLTSINGLLNYLVV